MVVFKTPAYLNELIQRAVPVCPLRSSDVPLPNVPRTRTEFADLLFLVTVLHTWNSIPSNVRSRRIVDTFKRHLKTHLFSLNLMPPAPLHLQTLWWYTNAVTIIIIITVIKLSQWLHHDESTINTEQFVYKDNQKCWSRSPPESGFWPGIKVSLLRVRVWFWARSPKPGFLVVVSASECGVLNFLTSDKSPTKNEDTASLL